MADERPVMLITGAGRGIGAAVARAAAAKRYHVVLNYSTSSDPADELAAEIRETGCRAVTVQTDVADEAAVRSMFAHVDERFGRLDVLVNSAAEMERRTVAETTVEDWDATMALNLRAPFLVAQQAAPHLKATQGRIVNIADLSGFEPWRNYVAHSVSKAGVVMLTKVLAVALAPEITVNGIAPGTVLVPDDYDDARRTFLSETTPLGRLGTPGDAVAALRYLVHHAPFVTGDTIVVDGGRLLRR